MSHGLGPPGDPEAIIYLTVAQSHERPFRVNSHYIRLTARATRDSRVQLQRGVNNTG